MNMEEGGNANTCSNTHTQEKEEGRCRWKRRIGIHMSRVMRTSVVTVPKVSTKFVEKEERKQKGGYDSEY